MSGRAQRVPGAAASLAVQLPSALNAVASTEVEPTDVELLRTSILSNQARQRVLLGYQERLLEGGVSGETLKRALCYLSPSAWAQVGEERRLAGLCAYPRCENPPPARKGGTHRISLARRKVYRSTDDDGDQEGGYCSKACWRRAEWVRTWVLKDRQEGTQGGRWERDHDESEWTKIELLEDLEQRGELEGLIEKEHAKLSQPTSPKHRSDAARRNKETEGKQTPQEQVEALVESLVIRERDNKAPAHQQARWTEDVPNSMGASITGIKAPPSNKEEDDDDDDVLGITTTDLRAVMGGTAKVAAEDDGASDSDEADLDPKVLAERRETLRLMDEGMRALAEQRELGLLD